MKAVVLAGAHALKDAGALEKLEMSRNRRPGNLERLRQFRDGAVRTRHAKKDFSSRGMGERAEDIVHVRCVTFNHFVNSCAPTRVRCQVTINFSVKYSWPLRCSPPRKLSFLMFLPQSLLMTSATMPPVERAPTKDTFQTLATWDSFDPTGARRMSKHPFAV